MVGWRSRAGRMPKMSNAVVGAFGAWLDMQLTRKSMSSADFARAVGVTGSAVSSWLTGRATPRPYRCRVIAETLGLSYSEVLVAAGHRDISDIRDTMPAMGPGGSDLADGGVAMQADYRGEWARAQQLTGGRRLSLTLDLERWLDSHPDRRQEIEDAAIEAAILRAADLIRARG